MEQILNKSQHAKLTLENKVFPLLLPGFNLADFQSRVLGFYQQAIPACLSQNSMLVRLGCIQQNLHAIRMFLHTPALLLTSVTHCDLARHENGPVPSFGGKRFKSQILQLRLASTGFGFPMHRYSVNFYLHYTVVAVP